MTGRRSVVVSGIRAAFLALGVLVAVVTLTPLVDWWAHLLSGRFTDPTGEVLIILSSSELADGIPDASSYWRAAYGIRAWRNGAFEKVVVSGGQSADAMKAFLVCGGVPASAILVEDRSRSTRENALYTQGIVGALPGRKVLLTSDYHMFRARLVFRKVGIAVTGRPIPDVRKRAVYLAGRWGAFLDLCVETVKLVGYSVRGWI